MSQESLNKKQTSPDSTSHSSMDDGVARVAISEKGDIVYASEAFYTLSHLSPDQAPRVDALSLIRFEDIESLSHIESGVHTVKLNGHADGFDFHFDWMTAPDQRRYLIGSQAPAKKKITKKAMKAAQDNVLRYLQDNRRQGQGALISAQEDMEQFLAMSADVMLVLDSAGEILKANTRFLKLFDFASTRDLQGLFFADLFAESERPHIRGALQTLSFGEREGGASHTDFEALVKTKAEVERCLEWRQRRMGDVIYCTGRDITAIKTQEKALLSRERQLSEAESIARMGHWHWTLGQEELQWSPEIYRIFGLSEGDLRPTLLGMNEMVHRADVGRLNQALQRAIIEENNYDMEFRIIRPDGEIRHIRCEGRCAKDADGEVVALYGIMQDMTERMLYESDLKEAKESAERAYAAKTQFLANMSHELRTPLNAIIGFSEMMQRQLLGPIGTPRYLEYLSGIRESGEHLLDLISDILDMSKIEAGKYQLDLAPLNVKKTVEIATHMMEGRALESGIKISMPQESDDDLSIIADRRAFMQIMLNLLSNAVKFSKPGGQVHVECHKREDYVAIKVIDTGIGIPAHKLGSITKPFEQVSSSYARSHEGSGLGLSITKELVEMHGGVLAIESTVDQGTTVTVRLPYEAMAVH